MGWRAFLPLVFVALAQVLILSGRMLRTKRFVVFCFAYTYSKRGLMFKSFKRMAPVWIIYFLLFAMAATGPLLSHYGQFEGITRGHWVFLFLLPFSIGCMPLGFILGEIVQHRTRASGRTSWRIGFFHFIVMYAVFLTGVFDLLANVHDVLYYAVWLGPSFISGLLFVFGMFIMRVEQAHSDARYGVEVSRGDPWAPFFDLEWESDTPRKVTARAELPPAESESGSKRKSRRRRRRK